MNQAEIVGEKWVSNVIEMIKHMEKRLRLLKDMTGQLNYSKRESSS